MDSTLFNRGRALKQHERPPTTILVVSHAAWVEPEGRQSQVARKATNDDRLVPRLEPEFIRHSFAMLWIESEESAEVPQKVLGHSSIATAINTYNHLSPRYQRESFGRFGDVPGEG